MGIGPTRSAWKAEVLPLNYTRIFFYRFNIISFFYMFVNTFFIYFFTDKNYLNGEQYIYLIL